MKNTAIIQLSYRYQLAQTTAVLAATMVLPFLIHLLPNINGNLAGAVLLPIFVAPMIATFLFKKHVAILAGIIAPLLNYLIMGHPAPAMVITLAFEIVAFVLLLSWLKDLRFIKYLAAPLAFLAASLLVTIGLSLLGRMGEPVSTWLSGVNIALPGILLLGVINVILVQFKK
jgi:hypothetical protein